MPATPPASLKPTQIATLRDIAQQSGSRLLLRPGIALYGYGPHAAERGLQPVLSWKTRITALRTIAAGEAVSYNATFRAARPTRIALLPVGYADGYNRLLSNRGEVLVRGQRAPIAGRVTMDQTMIDVTDIADAAIGDEVVLLGQQGSERITADDLAAHTGTIAYEVLCAVGARVPRDCGCDCTGLSWLKTVIPTIEQSESLAMTRKRAAIERSRSAVRSHAHITSVSDQRKRTQQSAPKARLPGWQILRS